LYRNAESRRVKIFVKKNDSREIAVSDIKISEKALVIKSVWC
jgi:hypothetical protein